MMSCNIKFRAFVFLFILLGFAGTSIAEHTYEEIYTPPYDRCSTWKKKGGFASNTAGANRETGVIGVFAAAFAGGAACEASQFVEEEDPYGTAHFHLTSRSSVEVSVLITYSGGTVNLFHGAWCGTAWHWKLDDKRAHKHIID